MVRRLVIAAMTIAAGAIAAPALGLAQNAPGAPGTNQVIPEKDPSATQHGASGSAGAGAQEGRSSTLSDKLNKSNGVITPPTGMDPAIQKSAPAPHPNSTPVIPPPAASGSGGVQAK